MVLSAFATLTLLTKNSFLDEIRKQYVTTARAKGSQKTKVLYKHVFRNAMLIIIAGFPAAFIGAFFQALFSSKLFSRSMVWAFWAMNQCSTVIIPLFATLFIFSLLGLVVGLISTSPIHGLTHV